MMTSAKDEIAASGQPGNNRPTKLSDDIDMTTPGEPKSPNNHAITAHFEKLAKDNDLSVNIRSPNKVETRIAAVTARLDHADAQLKNVKHQFVRLDNKLKRTAREMVISELRSQDGPFSRVVHASARAVAKEQALDTDKAISALQTQMDRLNLIVKHMPKAKVDEGRDVREGTTQPWPRQPAAGQQPAATNRSDFSKTNLGRIRAAEGNIDKINEELEAKSREIAELREKNSQLQELISNLNRTVKSFQQQLEPE